MLFSDIKYVFSVLGGTVAKCLELLNVVRKVAGLSMAQTIRLKTLLIEQ